MRKTFIVSCIIALLIGCSLPSDAQVKRGNWDFAPVIKTTNSIYGLLANALLGSTVKSAWSPKFESHFAAPQSLEIPDVEVKMKKYWDWELRNIGVSYRVTYMSTETPFGFSAQVGYEKRGFTAAFPEEDTRCYFNRQMIVPEALLHIRFGDYVSNTLNPLVVLGAGYDYAFDAKSGQYKGHKTVDSGVRGIFGIGVGNTRNHIQVYLRYEYCFYDWFNKSYSPDGGITKPYEGWKTKMGNISISASYGF